jgi:phosphoglycerate kinase
MVDPLPTLDELGVDGRRVLLPADLNLPLEQGPTGAAVAVAVADDTRIRAALTTIEELLRRGARLVLASHLGRPSGRDPLLSMRPVAERVAALTGARVTRTPAVVGAQVRELTERLAPGEILVLENLRYEPGETRNDPELVAARPSPRCGASDCRTA